MFLIIKLVLKMILKNYLKRNYNIENLHKEVRYLKSRKIEELQFTHIHIFIVLASFRKLVVVQHDCEVSQLIYIFKRASN